jgi:DNA-directed RNA polymerase subunit RPC12/RpoP
MNWNKWVNKHPTRVSTEYTCSICLTDLSVDDNWRAISCPATMTEGIPHCFHKECIKRWVNVRQGSYTCPVCRRNAIEINRRRAALK